MMFSGVLIVFQTRKIEYDLIKEELENTANFIEKSVYTEGTVEDVKNNIINILTETGSSLRNKKIFLLDEMGNIIFTQSVNVREEGLYTSQVMAALLNEEIDEFDELHLSDDNITYLGISQSIVKDDRVIFVVYIAASTEQVQEKISTMVIVISLAVLLSVFLSVLLAFLFSSFLTRPISALTSKARDMAKGKLDDPIEVFSNDEIGELTVNFNKMAYSLNDTLEQIAGEKNKMETVIVHMTDGILVFDNFGILIHYNPAAIKMLGLSWEQNFKEIFRNRLEVQFDLILNEIENAPKKSTLTNANKYLSIEFARYLNKDGSSKGLICVIQDITEHKKLEKMQKEFVANVSHELRTPLTTIKSYAETLIEGAVNEPEVAVQFLQVINTESDRMTTLVQDLLELSKLDNQKNSFVREVVNLSHLLFDSVENYRIHANKKNQELVMKGIEEECFVLGDPNRIEQVIKNILSNAVKYSGENASIRVELKHEEWFYIVFISDTGMGIPEEDLEHIFDRFYRVDKARSRAMGGTGLGLAIAKEIMELHGGKIQVRSVLNVGTTFSLHFPRCQDKNVIE